MKSFKNSRIISVEFEFNEDSPTLFTGVTLNIIDFLLIHLFRYRMQQLDHFIAATSIFIS